MTYLRWREALYNGVLGGFEDLLMWGEKLCICIGRFYIDTWYDMYDLRSAPLTTLGRDIYKDLFGIELGNHKGWLRLPPDQGKLLTTNSLENREGLPLQ